MNLLSNSKEDNNEKRLYQTSKDGIVFGTAFKIKDVNFSEIKYDGHLFLTARHCVEEYDEKMFYNPFYFKENTGKYLPLTIFNNVDANTFCPAYPDLIVKHPKLDIAAIIIPKIRWSHLGNTGTARYKKYDVNRINISDPPCCLKIPVFRSKYTKEKETMYFCKDTGKNFKILQIDEEHSLIRLEQNILGGWSGSPAINPNNKKVIGIVSKGFKGKDGNGTIVYFDKHINKWLEEVENKLRYCFTGITLNDIPALIHNRQIKIKRNTITNDIISVEVYIK